MQRHHQPHASCIMYHVMSHANAQQCFIYMLMLHLGITTHINVSHSSDQPSRSPSQEGVYTVTLLLPPVHRILPLVPVLAPPGPLGPPPALNASAPQFPPISPSSLPTSRPHAYPAEKLIAENSKTKPADIIHDAIVGDIRTSSADAVEVAGGFERIFLEFRSLEEERERRLIGLALITGCEILDSGTSCRIAG